jgi:hypothetical protein
MDDADNLPNLFVVGAAKAGTTALYHYFRAHPQVFVPRELKETNYMAFQAGMPKLAGPKDKRYVGRSVTTLEAYQALYRERTSEPVVADVSPSYLYYPEVAGRIARLAPQAKIVIVLRNPVESAFSMYAMMRRDRREPCTKFAEAFHQSEQRIADGWEWAWDYKRGYEFSRQVSHYLERFPTSQLFISLYEHLHDNPEAFYADLTRFLNIDMIDLAGTNRRVNAAPRRGDRLKKSRAGSLLLRAGLAASRLVPSTIRDRLRHTIDSPAHTLEAADRRMLVEHYRDDIARLAEMLKWDLSHWTRP